MLAHQQDRERFLTEAETAEPGRQLLKEFRRRRQSLLESERSISHISLGPHRQGQQGCLPHETLAQTLALLYPAKILQDTYHVQKSRGGGMGGTTHCSPTARLSSYNVVVLSRLRGLGSRKGGSFTRRENSDRGTKDPTSTWHLWAPCAFESKSKKGSWGFGWGTVYYSPGREGSVTLEFSRSLTKVLGDSIGQRPCQLKLPTATGIYSVVKNNYKNTCDHMAKCRNESII